jgi:hypothetical protein
MTNNTTSMTTQDQIESVKAAVDEFYTCDDIFYFIKEGIWTKEMFKQFFHIMQSKARKQS